MKIFFNFIPTHEKIYSVLPVGKLQSSFHLRLMKVSKCQLKIQWTWAASKFKTIKPKLQGKVSITKKLAG